MVENKRSYLPKGLIVLVLTLVSAPVFAAPTQNDLPGVPLRTVEETVQPREVVLTPKFKKKPESSNQETSFQVASNKEEKPPAFPAEATATAVNLKPGVNVIVSIAQNHPNRIITPFEMPKVHTASSADITVDESVIYVTPADSSPVTMFITEKDEGQGQAVSLTLAPQSMPPREVRLLMDGAGTIHGGGFVSSRAQDWELTQQYTEVIEKTMRDLALGGIPQGYGLRNVEAGDPQVNCQMPGVEITPGQVLEGHNIIGVVGRATNRGSSAIEIRESSCYAQNVLAVAAWPTVRLAPEQATELYVLFRRPQPEEMAKKRPSLLSQEVR